MSAQVQLFLDQRRGDVPGLITMLHKGYAAEASSLQYKRYTHKGEEELYEQIGDPDVNSVTLVSEALEFNGGQQVSVLDIGAGACTQMIQLKEKFGDDVAVVGITGHPAGLLKPGQLNRIRASGVDLRVGNADFWERVVRPDERFDIVFSQLGLRWFGDPLAAMERALSQTKEGGTFWARPIRLPIDTLRHSVINETLTAANYPATEAYDSHMDAIYELMVLKETDSTEPIFTNLEYAQFFVNIGNRLTKHGDRRKQAYYQLIENV
ncbi:MAG: Methyltransferase domain [Candidatus Saccharibacteria bacterium]|nr:Methyltransferase domain [Candidatus Saccharibacteria bacterium]